MQLNEKQQLAVNRATDWYATQNTQVFKMAGYAGTGKTTVATTIARTLNQLIDFCRRRRKNCNDCPIAFECSYVRRGLKPGDLLGFDTDDDD